MDLGIIFCGSCNSTKVDSGFQGSTSTLKCCECGNEGEFRIGHMNLETESVIKVAELLSRAKADAF